MRLFEVNPYGTYQSKDRTDRPTLSAEDVLVGLSRTSQRHVDPIAAAIRASKSAACIVNVIQTGNRWTGSGFLVEGNIVVTAEHVLPRPDMGEAVIFVSFDGDATIPARIISGDSDVDVGLLQIPPVSIKPMTLATEGVMEGDIIAVIGAPEGWSDVVTVGRVSGTEMTPPQPPDPSWTNMIFIDAHILEGSSGSMVIDVLGQVVGMVMGMIGRHVIDRGLGQNAVISSSRIHRAIEEALGA